MSGGWSGGSSGAGFLFQPPLNSPYRTVGPGVRFSPTELKHLTIAFLVLTFDLILIWIHVELDDGYPITNAIWIAAGVAAPLAAATGFAAHEMAHKFTAQRRGLWAEFRMSMQGLVISLIFSALFGFLLAAPGATLVGGTGNIEEAGVTSLAGPGTNMIEAAIFSGLTVLLWRNLFWSGIFGYVAFINLVFAIFNLIPWGPLDGRKVLSWSRSIWGVSFAIAVVGGIAAFLFLPNAF